MCEKYLLIITNHFRKHLDFLFTKEDYNFAEIYACIACKFSYLNATWNTRTKLITSNKCKFSTKWFTYHAFMALTWFLLAFSVWRLLSGYDIYSPMQLILYSFLLVTYTSGFIGVFGMDLCQRDLQTVFNELLLQCRSRKHASLTQAIYQLNS